MRKVNILIVEDEFPIALDIQSRVEKMGYQVVDICNTFDLATEVLASNDIQVALLDVNLNDEKDGFDIAAWINENSTANFLFITAYSDDFTFRSALDLNPAGFVNKPFTDKELFHQIELALKHSEAIKEKEIAWRKSFNEKVESIEDATSKTYPAGWEELSKREVEVAVLLSEGLSDKELAEKLYVSPSTVRTHLRRIYDKLLVSSRLEVVALLNKHQLI